MLDGICCDYCSKHEKPECPVKTTDHWDSWKDFCSQFDSRGLVKVELDWKFIDNKLKKMDFKGSLITHFP